MPPEKPYLEPSQLADLSALADGSLDPRRREEVRGWVLSSPELHELYERERLAVGLLHEAASRDRAPDPLRQRVERDRAARQRPARQKSRPTPQRSRFALVLGPVVAVTVLVLALALPSGTPGAPSVSEAAALARLGPTAGAPSADPRHPTTRLAQGVEDVYFPNWSSTLGWRAVGQRSDRPGGRVAVTVYYARRGQRVAYTIVGGPALPKPRGAVTWLHGVELRTLKAGGRTIVTWRRNGRTCVLSTVGVPASAMQQLAAWHEL